MTFKRLFLRIYWVLAAQLGIDPRLTFRAIKGLPRFLRDARKFRTGYNGPMEFTPCFHDWYAEGGAAQNEYFLQDLLVARMIFRADPKTHVDIGSRVDGFVAHVASFREIEVFDVRPITSQIPGVKFVQADLMNPVHGRQGYCDSLSCLHALEHFGLGRYGDPIDPNGFEAGLANMSELIQEHGLFYLSLPIGIERVEFNANRVFDPRGIVKLAAKYSLRPMGFTVVRQNGRVEELALDEKKLADLAKELYNLGIFIFKKVSHSST